MSPSPLTGCLGAIIGAAALLVAAGAAIAAPHSSIRVPMGARISVHGSAVMLMSNGGIAGSYNCSCNSPNGGSCSVKQSPGVLECVSDTKQPCSACEMESTTNPKNGIDAARSAVSHSAATKAP